MVVFPHLCHTCGAHMVCLWRMPATWDERTALGLETCLVCQSAPDKFSGDVSHLISIIDRMASNAQEIHEIETIRVAITDQQGAEDGPRAS